jgi:hypothetical protein
MMNSVLRFTGRGLLEGRYYREQNERIQTATDMGLTTKYPFEQCVSRFRAFSTQPSEMHWLIKWEAIFGGALSIDITKSTNPTITI